MANNDSRKSLEGEVSPSPRHPRMGKEYEVEVNERRLDEEPPSARTPDRAPSSQADGALGPYNRDRQFEATEEGDKATPAAEPAGALNKDRPNWQDEGRSAPTPTDTAQKESDPEERGPS